MENSPKHSWRCNFSSTGEAFFYVVALWKWSPENLTKLRNATINILNAIYWIPNNHQAPCQPSVHILPFNSHKIPRSTTNWLGRNGSKGSDELLKVTWLVDGRGWPLCLRPATSKVHPLLSWSCCLPGARAVAMAPVLAGCECQGHHTKCCHLILMKITLAWQDRDFCILQ